MVFANPGGGGGVRLENNDFGAQEQMGLGRCGRMSWGWAKEIGRGGALEDLSSAKTFCRGEERRLWGCVSAGGGGGESQTIRRMGNGCLPGFLFGLIDRLEWR